jgi:ribose transport system permease protein
MSKVSSGQAPAVPTGGAIGDLGMRLVKSQEFVIALVVVLLLIIGAFINPNFMTVSNQKANFRDIAILAIAGIGVAFPILTAGIDLSIGSMVGVGGVMVAISIVRWGLPIWAGIVITLVIGFVIGSIHGLFVTKLKMHGFLITLVTMGAARGALLVITSAFPIPGLPPQFTFIGQGYLFNVIPIPVVICAAVAGLAFYVLRFSYIGRQIYAVGGNIEAARFSGINVDARIMLCYITSVLCAVLVGMIQAARMTQGHPGSGQGYELQAITACIVGGVSFMGGEGGILGIILGAMLMGTLANAMVMLNVSAYWHQIVISMVLLTAITVDYMRRRQQT